jgi:hypothetical protein
VEARELETLSQNEFLLISHDFYRLIFFGGYDYAPQGQHRGTFEYDVSSSLGVSV